MQMSLMLAEDTTVTFGYVVRLLDCPRASFSSPVETLGVYAFAFHCVTWFLLVSTGVKLLGPQEAKPA